MQNRSAPNSGGASGSASGSKRAKTGHRRTGSKNNSHRAANSTGRRPKSKALSSRTVSRSSRQRGVAENDLDDILHELAEIEARLNETMQSLQTEITNCSNYMLDSVIIWGNTAFESTRECISEVQNLRDVNQKTERQCKIISGI